MVGALHPGHVSVFRKEHGKGAGQKGNTGINVIALLVETYIACSVIRAEGYESRTRDDVHPLSPCENELDVDVGVVGFVTRTVEGTRFIGGDIGEEVIAENDVPSIRDVGSGMGEKSERPLPERPGAVAPPVIKRGNDHAVTPE